MKAALPINNNGSSLQYHLIGSLVPPCYSFHIILTDYLSSKQLILVLCFGPFKADIQQMVRLFFYSPSLFNLAMVS